MLYILDRGYHVLPEDLPSDKIEDYKLLYDIATTYMFRPQERWGARVEEELLNGQKVMHAYGQESRAFTYSFGVASAVGELVAQYADELPLSSRL